MSFDCFVFLSKSDECCGFGRCCPSSSRSCDSSSKECCPDSSKTSCDSSSKKSCCVVGKLFLKLEERAKVCPFSRALCWIISFTGSILCLVVKIAKVAIAIIIVLKLVDFFSKKYYRTAVDHALYSSACSIASNKEELVVRGDCAKNIFKRVEKEIKGDKNCKVVSKLDNKNEEENEFILTGSCISRVSSIIRKQNESHIGDSSFYVKMPNLEVFSK